MILQHCLGQKQELFVYGNDYPTPDGTCIRDYVHVDDLASAHSLAIDATNEETREVFNIGTGTGNSVLQVIEACRSITKSNIDYEFMPRRPGDSPILVANSHKIRRTLGWAPDYPSIEAIVQSAWNWHRSHRFRRARKHGNMRILE